MFFWFWSQSILQDSSVLLFFFSGKWKRVLKKERERVHVSVQMHGRLLRDWLQMWKTWFSFLVCMVQSNVGWKTTLWPLNWVEWKFNQWFLTARRLLWLMVCFLELESRDFWFSEWSCHTGISWKCWAEVLVFQQKGWLVWINLKELALDRWIVVYGTYIVPKNVCMPWDMGILSWLPYQKQ